jgi:phosphopantetheinyl transferase
LASVAAICAELPERSVSWLSASEQMRCEAISAPRRRQQFLAGHWFARQCLARWGGGVWSDYVLSASDDAPLLVLQAPFDLSTRPVHVSVSHSADSVACAVASHPIGVDVEDTTRERDIDALGDFIHGPREEAGLAGLNATVRRHQFFARWSLKEAWIKHQPTSLAMSAIECEPGDSMTAEAVVLHSAEWVVAVLPVQIGELRVCGEAFDDAAVTPWRFLPLQSPENLGV